MRSQRPVRPVRRRRSQLKLLSVPASRESLKKAFRENGEFLSCSQRDLGREHIVLPGSNFLQQGAVNCAEDPQSGLAVFVDQRDEAIRSEVVSSRALRLEQ